MGWVRVGYVGDVGDVGDVVVWRVPPAGPK